MSTAELESRLKLAIAAAREAATLIMGYFQGTALKVEIKADASPVTVADREAEQLLRGRIAAEFPDDAILGEEFPEHPGRSGYRWIVDPIDGTKSFIHGVPLFGTLIGVEHGGTSAVGVIHLPALDEMVSAAFGLGAWHVRGSQPPTRARVSSVASLDESLFCTSDPAGYRRLGRQPAYERLETACRLSRSWGDCYGYLLVATGRAELMVDPAMSVWDAAALQPILEEAGGTLTDWRGQRTIYAGEAIATNGLVLDDVIAITRTLAKPAR